MSNWLEKGLYYWEGDPRPQAQAIEVPRRPGEGWVWDGTAWQEQGPGYYVYDKPSMRWVRKSPEEIAALGAAAAESRAEALFLSSRELLKAVEIIVREIEYLRPAAKPRQPAFQALIDRLQEIRAAVIAARSTQP